jgi:hypothetical protein
VLTKTHEINNIIININNKDVVIEINSQSDIISLYVIIKFFTRKDNIFSLYMTDSDEKGVITYTKENHFKTQDMSLNNFLHYYTTQSIIKENTSGFNDNDDTKKIIGWRFVFTKNINLDKRDISFIEKKIMEYRDSKFKNKKFH